MGCRDMPPSLAPAAPLVGEKVYLNALEPADVNDTYLGWLNDPEVMRYLGSAGTWATRESLLKYLERFQDGVSDLILAIRERSTRLHLGNVTINHVDWTLRKGHLGILIGRKEYWGKGYALEALRLFLDHLFRVVGLHKVTAGAPIDNAASIITLKKLGFRTEGMLRHEALVDGAYRDVVWLGLLAEECQPVAVG